MNDRELLELAAKAAGIELGFGDGDAFLRKDSFYSWNPLVNDGDALRLAVKLRFDLTHCCPGSIKASCGHIEEGYGLGNDPNAATRRAIVRAAAEIGGNVK